MNDPRYPRLTTESFEEFLIEYRRGDFVYLRLGQAAFIHFKLNTDDGLFACMDDVKSEQMIRELLRSYQA